VNLFKFIHKKYPEDVFSRFEHPIRAELYSIAHLEGHGESLAKAQPVFKSSRRGKNLRSRVAENGRVLLASYNAIIEAVREQRAITPAAEWLIDNFHIVEEQLKDIRDHMPPEYYHELPKLSEGPLSGYPRVYGMAWAFIAHTDSLFDPEPLSRFVKA
jgi:cyclic beta-1,2-glucan synthetase